MVAGLREFTARVERNGVDEPVLDAENGEELMHVQPCVSIVLGNRPPESPGTLYISTKYAIISLMILYVFVWVKIKGIE